MAFAKVLCVGADEHDGLPDSHGEFGVVALFDNERRQKLRNWVKSPEGGRYVDEVSAQLHHGTGIAADAMSDFVKDQGPNGLCQRIEIIAASSEFAENNLANRLAEAGILPIFGMPTRLRRLYCNLPKYGHGENRPSYIDREIDLAITEFEPGAKRTRDKLTYSPVGLVGDIKWSQGEQRWIAGNEPVVNARWQIFCERCSYFRDEEFLTSHNGIPFGESQFQNEEQTGVCPRCATPVFARKAVTPVAFYTDKDPDDGPEGDATGRSGRAHYAFNVGDAGVGPEVTTPCNTSTRLELVQQGRVYTINRGLSDKGRGFRFQEDWEMIQIGQGQTQATRRWKSDGRSADQAWLIGPAICSSESSRGSWRQRRPTCSVFGPARRSTDSCSIRLTCLMSLPLPCVPRFIQPRRSSYGQWQPNSTRVPRKSTLFHFINAPPMGWIVRTFASSR